MMSGTTLQDLQQQLLTEVSAVVAKHGFGRKPSGQTFFLHKPFGWAAFHLTFMPHDDTDFDVTADVALRIDAVEKLVNEDNPILSKAEKARTASLGGALGNLSAGKPRRWTVASEADVQPVAASIQALLEAVGIPYIATYAHLEKALHVLASNAPTTWRHAPIHGARCQRALALACVLGKYDRLDEIVSQSESFLTARNDSGLKAFQQFADKLRLQEAIIRQVQ